MSRFLSRLSRTPSSTSIKSSTSTDAPDSPPKTSQVLTRPVDGYKPASSPELTLEQEDKLTKLVEFLTSYSNENPPAPDYLAWEHRWMAEPELYQRYLRAAKGDLDNAKKRIQSTLEWRREFRPELIDPSKVQPEAETGKQVVSGFDNQGRPILYLRPSRENTKPSQRQVEFLVWSLERAIEMMPPGVDNMTIIVDYNSATSQSNPSLTIAKQVAHILQNHYVERMGRAFVCNTPWFIKAFFTAITPFLDPTTKEKIRFNANLSEFIPVEQLDAGFQGGRYNYQFDFDTYWKTMIDFCGIAADGTRTHESYARSESPKPTASVRQNMESVSTEKPSDPVSESLVSAKTETETAVSNGSPASSSYKTLAHLADYEKLMQDYDTFLFDCDGVLWSGDETIAGVVSVLGKLRKRGKSVIFVTNNASKSRATYLKKFASMNIEADLSEVFSSSYASAVYLKRVLNFPADRKVYVIGMHGIEEELDAEGILHCGGTDPKDNQFLPALDFTQLGEENAIDPKVGAVVCGFDMHLSYIKIAKAFKHLTRPGAEGEVVAEGKGGGCHFILTNDDSTFPAQGGPWPGAGSLSIPLVFSTKRTPTIVGKPHKPMLDCIIATKQFDKARAIMVGDRLNTDIEFAKAGGIASMLVLTGITKKEEIDEPNPKTVPDYLIHSLGDLDALP